MSSQNIEIVELEPQNRDHVQEWIELQTAVAAHDIPGGLRPSPVGRRASLTLTTAAVRTERRLALADGHVVGWLQLRMPLKDNQHLVEIDLEVHPDHRRRGIGTRLLEFTERRAREEGRDTLLSWLVDSLYGLDDYESAGARFAERRGFPQADVEIHRRNDLIALDEDHLERLYEEAWKKAEGYELVEWVGSTPDEIAEGVAALEARMSTDPPMGDMDIRQSVYDVERLRDEERVWAERGDLLIGTAVRHIASGSVGGLTAIFVVAGDEHDAIQGDTIVDPKHRGRRLGTILKIANQRRLLRYRPQMRYVHTWNADANDHMVSINEAIGYRRFLRELAVQKKLGSTAPD